MYPLIPQELTQSVIQLLVYSFTVFGVVLGVMTGGRL
jgi:hypothetical protein